MIQDRCGWHNHKYSLAIQNPIDNLALLVAMGLRAKVTREFVSMSAGQFLWSRFHKMTLITILCLLSQCNVMGCRLQQQWAGVLLLSPKSVVNLAVIAGIHPGAVVAYSMRLFRSRICLTFDMKELLLIIRVLLLLELRDFSLRWLQIYGRGGRGQPSCFV